MSSYLEDGIRRVLGDDVVEDPLVTEFAVNPDGSFWWERAGDAGMRPLSVGPDAAAALRDLATDVAGDNALSDRNPLAGGQFELHGALWRAQVLVPPVIAQGVAISLRRAVAQEMSLDALLGGLDVSMRDLKGESDPADDAAFDAYDRDDFGGFLRAAVAAKWNILLSGGTSSGKTTWLRAMLGCLDPDERILTIEDVREIRPTQKNAVEMFVRPEASSAELLKAALRLRPDRIVMGELRGPEAFDFLSAINSGHPGGVSTLHASSPETALSRLALMVMQADTGLTYSEILDYCRTMIDCVIQFRKVGQTRRPVAVRIFREKPSGRSDVTSAR